jgi:hypothetical protein
MSVQKSDPARVALRPRFGTIKAASQYSGISRSKLYEEAPKYEGLFRKWDGRTIVDFDLLDSILNALPIAEIKPAPRKRAKRAS